jgi:hypothetical protein
MWITENGPMRLTHMDKEEEAYAHAFKGNHGLKIEHIF